MRKDRRTRESVAEMSQSKAEARATKRASTEKREFFESDKVGGKQANDNVRVKLSGVE